MKNSIKLISASAIALLALSTTTSVFAAGENSSANSTGHIGIKINNDTDTTVPYDPNDPDHPAMGDNTDPSDPNNKGTAQAGPLSLDYVSNIDFGMNESDAKGAPYYLSTLDQDGNATKNPLEYTPWVQVTDKRNTGSGWTLSVNFDKDGQFKDGTKDLKGAILSFGNATFTPKEKGNVSATPTHDGLTEVSDKANITATAAKDSGMGTWFEQYAQGTDEKSSTHLYVPAGNTAGDYKAKLVWTLTDAAQA